MSDERDATRQRKVAHAVILLKKSRGAKALQIRGGDPPLRLMTPQGGLYVVKLTKAGGLIMTKEQ